MKLFINKSEIDMAPSQFLRQAGYTYIRDNRMGHDSFVKHLGGGHYPRLHMYVSEQGERVVFDLHLDQKQASYHGSHMHNAEYDGEVVAAEIGRLRVLTAKSAKLTQGSDDNNLDPMDKIGHGEYDKGTRAEKKKSWWQKLFG